MIGFTGTRNGMTEAQKVSVRRILQRLGFEEYGNAVGHGDCVGSDADFDQIAASFGYVRRLYPCDIDRMRAHCERLGALVAREPGPPLKRNGWIVDDSRVLIATPREYREELRSGTWSTIRRAQRKDIPRLIVTPDGNLLP